MLRSDVARPRNPALERRHGAGSAQVAIEHQRARRDVLDWRHGRDLDCSCGHPGAARPCGQRAHQPGAMARVPPCHSADEVRGAHGGATEAAAGAALEAVLVGPGSPYGRGGTLVVSDARRQRADSTSSTTPMVLAWISRKSKPPTPKQTSSSGRGNAKRPGLPWRESHSMTWCRVGMMVLKAG